MLVFATLVSAVFVTDLTGDEAHPICGQCGKKSRDCRWEPAHSRFRSQQPGSMSRSSGGGSSSNTPGTAEGTENRDFEKRDNLEATASDASSAILPSLPVAVGPNVGDSWVHREGHVAPGIDGLGTEYQSTGKVNQDFQSSTSPFLSQVTSPVSSRDSGRLSIPSQTTHALPYREALSLSNHEARLIHHYAHYLGRWLDGTCPARQFSLRIPKEVKHCPILLQATLCFAAHHLNDTASAISAYQRCITLLIERLNVEVATHSDNILCAIVILRFYEQLNVPPKSGSDSEQHLAGSSALIRASQNLYVDPRAPTLRDASFWVYVRQCLYNSTIDQQPPNLDLSLLIEPHPSSLPDAFPWTHLASEAAWANQITWHCACVASFCFDDTSDRSQRMIKWDALWSIVQLWRHQRPSSFDPIRSGHDPDRSVFPSIYFTADWHSI